MLRKMVTSATAIIHRRVVILGSRIARLQGD
jgi:hypothetical protein